MSAVLEAAPPTQTPKRLSPVEYVAALPIEDQEAIFVHLVREMVRENEGAVVIPLETAEGNLGYFLTPEGMQAYYDAYGPKLTAEQSAELQRRVENPDQSKWLTMEEMLAVLDAADPVPPPTPG